VGLVCALAGEGKLGGERYLICLLDKKTRTLKKKGKVGEYCYYKEGCEGQLEGMRPQREKRGAKGHQLKKDREEKKTWRPIIPTRSITRRLGVGRRSTEE